MPIVSTDIQYRLSGGASNSTGNSSLGGAMSNAAVSAAVNALFNYVSGDEAASGGTDYRCIYVTNNNASLTLYGAKVWINSNTPSTSTDAQIGLGSAAINAAEQTVANAQTAPAAVTFAEAASESAALAIGDLAPLAYKAIWIKRVVTAGAPAYSGDGVSITVKGETAA